MPRFSFFSLEPHSLAHTDPPTVLGLHLCVYVCYVCLGFVTSPQEVFAFLREHFPVPQPQDLAQDLAPLSVW